ncbi:MAG: helix-turn-helix domain-containing protein [Planctomycetaceae bacterium]|nr:helix-turn-helix domain-containing protein [Planctomycetaceae bacterium]
MGGEVCPSNAKNANPSGRPARLTPDGRLRVAELYAGALTCRKIADLFGCSPTKASQTLCKLGVKMRFTRQTQNA